jgi:hypothetical protein
MATSPSPLPVLLPDHARLEVESLYRTDDAIVVIAGATGDTAQAYFVPRVWGDSVARCLALLPFFLHRAAAAFLRFQRGFIPSPTFIFAE